MFNVGDLVVLRDGYGTLLEVASCTEQEGCDLWNENDSFLSIDISELRYATVVEREMGTRLDYSVVYCM